MRPHPETLIDLDEVEAIRELADGPSDPPKRHRGEQEKALTPGQYRADYSAAVLAGEPLDSFDPDLLAEYGCDPDEDRDVLAKRRRAGEMLAEAAKLRVELDTLDKQPKLTAASRVSDLPDLTLAQLTDAIMEVMHPGTITPAKRRHHEVESSIISLETEGRQELYRTASAAAKAKVAEAHAERTRITVRRNEIKAVAVGREVAEAEGSIVEILAGRLVGHVQRGERAEDALRRIKKGMKDLKARQQRARAEMVKLEKDAAKADAALADAEAAVWDVANLAWSYDRVPEPFRADYGRPAVGLEGTGFRRSKVEV